MGDIDLVEIFAGRQASWFKFLRSWVKLSRCALCVNAVLPIKEIVAGGARRGYVCRAFDQAHADCFDLSSAPGFLLLGPPEPSKTVSV